MYLDTITLTGLTAFGTHGVFPDEHITPQKFVVDVEYTFPTKFAITTDNVAATISYADVADLVNARIVGKHCDLIETLAQNIAEDILHLGARKVQVTVHKPQAPLPQNFTDVAVKICREAEITRAGERDYVVALGANLENPTSQLRMAIARIGQLFTLTAQSSFYQTAPILAAGQNPQPDYINAVVAFRSKLSPLEVLHELQQIELEQGRVRYGKWQARTLDLDIIAVSNIVKGSESAPDLIISRDFELLLPHPRSAKRRFVLEPWQEIDPTATLNEYPLSYWLNELSEQEVKLCGVSYE